VSGMPKNEREARRWVRLHFAEYVANADMAWDDVDCAPLEAIWADECVKIAARLRKSATSRSQHEGAER